MLSAVSYSSMGDLRRSGGVAVVSSVLEPGSGPAITDVDADGAGVASSGVGLDPVLALSDREFLLALNATVQGMESCDKLLGFTQLVELARQLVVQESPVVSELGGEGVLDSLESDVSAESSVSVKRRRRRGRRARGSRARSAPRSAGATALSVASAPSSEVQFVAHGKALKVLSYGQGYCYLWAVLESHIDRVAAELGPVPLLRAVLGVDIGCWESLSVLAALRVSVDGLVAHVRDPRGVMVIGDTRFLTVCLGYSALAGCARGSLGAGLVGCSPSMCCVAAHEDFRVGVEVERPLSVLRCEASKVNQVLEWDTSVPWVTEFGPGLLVGPRVDPGRPQLGVHALSFSGQGGQWSTNRRGCMGVYAELVLPSSSLAECHVWSHGAYYPVDRARVVLRVETDDADRPVMPLVSFDAQRGVVGREESELIRDVEVKDVLGAPVPQVRETVGSVVVPEFDRVVGGRALVARFWRFQPRRATRRGERARLVLEYQFDVGDSTYGCRVARCYSYWFVIHGMYRRLFGPPPAASLGLYLHGFVELTGTVLVGRFSLWRPPGSDRWVLSVYDGVGPEVGGSAFAPFAVSVSREVDVVRVSRGGVHRRPCQAGELQSVLSARAIGDSFTVHMRGGEAGEFVLGDVSV